MDQKHGNPPPPLNPPLRRARIRDPKTTRLHDKGIHPRTQPRRLAAPPANYRRFGTHDQRFRPPYRAKISIRSSAGTTASAATWRCASTPIFRNTASAGCSPASTTPRASSTPPTPAGYRTARTATENPFRTYVRKGFRIGPASVRTGFSSRRRKFRIPRAARPSAPAPTGSSRHARRSPRRKRSRCGACP